MLVFQLIFGEEKKATKRMLVPTISETTQRAKALNFIDRFILTLNLSTEAAVAVLKQKDQVRVTITKKVFEKLKRTFSTERETLFLLFADPKTSIITAAEENPNPKQQGKHGCGFDWEWVKKKTKEMEGKGFVLVGNYHSHTVPIEDHISRADYDHTLLSNSDQDLQPSGVSFNDMDNDRIFPHIANRYKIKLLGAVKNEEFGIRAFLPINTGLLNGSEKRVYKDYHVSHANRKILPGAEERLIGILNDPSLTGLFLKHMYGAKMLEFKLEIK